MRETQSVGTITGEQVEEQEPDALESLLEKVSLRDPLEIDMADGRKLEITKDEFIAYYLPKDATNAEKFHCFNQTRAAALNPLIQGQCHYFRTGDRPLSLFTGYAVYLEKAYASGLLHIGLPVHVVNETTGLPVSSTITIQIKDRPDFTWTTRFSEVVALYKDAPNKRWAKAPFQMLDKCTLVNIFRLCGLVSFKLPYVIEEMGEPIANGYRSITVEQLADYEEQEGQEGASVGEVSAANHQVDTSGFRVEYFKTLKRLGLEFETDEQRQDWQEQNIGTRHVNDLDTPQWIAIMGMMVDIANEINREPDPPSGQKPEETEGEHAEKTDRETGGSLEELAESFPPESGSSAYQAAKIAYVKALLDADRFPTSADQAKWEMENFEKEAKDFNLAEFSKATALLFEFMREKPENSSPTEDLKLEFNEKANLMFDTEDDLRRWEVSVIGVADVNEWDPDQLRTAILEMTDYTELDPVEREYRSLKLHYEERIVGKFADDTAQAVWQTTASQKSSDTEQWGIEHYEMAHKRLDAEEAAMEDVPPTGMPDGTLKITDETKTAIKEALARFPEMKNSSRKYKTYKSLAFKEFASKVLEEECTSINVLLDSDAQLVLNALNSELDSVGVAQGSSLFLVRDEQFNEMEDLVENRMPDRFQKDIKSSAMRGLIGTVIGNCPYASIRDLTENEAGDVLLAMKDMIQDEAGNGVKNASKLNVR